MEKRKTETKTERNMGLIPVNAIELHEILSLLISRDVDNEYR